MKWNRPYLLKSVTVGSLKSTPAIYKLLKFFNRSQFIESDNHKMNPRQKLLVGYITDYFMNNKAPTWKTVGSALKGFDVKSLFAGEILPDDFLKVLFVNDETLIKQISEFVYRHHQIIMMLMKEEYSLTSCTECGHYSRSVGFNWRRRFQSYQELDKDVWESKTLEPRPILGSTPSTPPEMVIIQEGREEISSQQKEEEEEMPKLKKCCKEFNPVF